MRNVDAAPDPLRFDDDVRSFFPMLHDDARGLAKWNNAGWLSLSLAGSLAMRGDVDGRVRKNSARHPARWGDGSIALGKLGEAQYQVAALLAFHAYSLHAQDRSAHELSSTLIGAITLAGLTTLAVKAVANTERPSDDWNGGDFGFPSYHAASSFALAAVLDERYGMRAGLPAYLLAGAIGYARIDERDHDLSDVVFGAALGWIIGKSVAGRRFHSDSRVRVLPWLDSGRSSVGLMFDTKY